MKRILRLSALAGGIVATVSLASVVPGPQSNAHAQHAQRTLMRGSTGRYYGGYRQGYGGAYVRGANAYSGYGNGPYGYGYDNGPYVRVYGGSGYYRPHYGQVYSPYPYRVYTPYVYGGY